MEYYDNKNQNVENTSDVTSSKTITDIKKHVVQVEIMILFLLIFQALLFFEPTLSKIFGEDFAFVIPFIYLAMLPFFVRVTNPGSILRAMLKWGLTGMSSGATIGGVAAGVPSGGMAAPVGAAIGGAAGFIVGVIAGPFMDEQNLTKKIYTQGEAREFLFKKRKKHPSLDFQKIIDATDPSNTSQCKIPMFISDGVIKCSKDDMIKWLESKCWR